MAWARVLWRELRVLWRCDNQAAMHAITAQTCRDKSLLHLVQCFFIFIEAYYQFELIARHLLGDRNTLTDHLSCDHHSSFFLYAPGMCQEPSCFPPPLPGLLLQGVDWTYPCWAATFTSTLTGTYRDLVDSTHRTYIPDRCESILIFCYCIHCVIPISSIRAGFILLCGITGEERANPSFN